jgi:hypothetical protein
MMHFEMNYVHQIVHQRTCMLAQQMKLERCASSTPAHKSQHVTLSHVTKHVARDDAENVVRTHCPLMFQIVSTSDVDNVQLMLVIGACHLRRQPQHRV